MDAAYSAGSITICITLLHWPLKELVRDAIISGFAASGFKDGKEWFDAPKNSAVTKAQIRTEQHHQITEIETRKKATSYYGLVNLFVSRFMAIASGGRDHAINI